MSRKILVQMNMIPITEQNVEDLFFRLNRLIRLIDSDCCLPENLQHVPDSPIFRVILSKFYHFSSLDRSYFGKQRHKRSLQQISCMFCVNMIYLMRST